MATVIPFTFFLSPWPGSSHLGVTPLRWGRKCHSFLKGKNEMGRLVRSEVPSEVLIQSEVRCSDKNHSLPPVPRGQEDQTIFQLRKTEAMVPTSVRNVHGSETHCMLPVVLQKPEQVRKAQRDARHCTAVHTRAPFLLAVFDGTCEGGLHSRKITLVAA